MTVRYKTLLFDADNTLFDFSLSERVAISKTMQSFGITPTEELILSYSAINDQMWKKLERGEIEKSKLRTERFAVFCKEHSFSLDAEKMATTYTDFLSRQTFTVDGMEELCRTLADFCDLYIVTNGIKYVQEARFQKSSFVPYFKDIFISEALGYEKPDPRYFEAVAKRIPDFSPKNALVIGDSLTSDIAGAIGVGIDSCWFNPKSMPNTKNLPITYTVKEPKDILPLVLV